MTLKLSSSKLKEIYNKARVSYFDCINHADNSYLNNELSIPLQEVQLRNSWVKAVFSETNEDIYSWEVEIHLWGASSIIGKYTYVEDDKGNMLDDILVFY